MDSHYITCKDSECNKERERRTASEAIDIHVHVQKGQTKLIIVLMFLF